LNTTSCHNYPVGGFWILICFFTVSASVFVFPKDTAAGDTKSEESVIIVHLLCTEPGRLRVDLVNEANFGDPDQPLQRQEIIMDKEGSSQPIALMFQGIEPGHYALRAFIDRNGDGRLNRGLFGPTEPWALSWTVLPKHGIPRFKDVAFQVDSGTTNIQMELKK
jgi:uncharacterized protein (DUF2141 family)